VSQAVAEGPRATDAFSAVAAACVAGVGALADTQEVTQLDEKSLNIAVHSFGALPAGHLHRVKSVLHHVGAMLEPPATTESSSGHVQPRHVAV
jgi:hypothetical protein